MDPIEQELRRMSDYDVEALAREEDFGKSGFRDCVPIARRIQEFYGTFPISAIPELPEQFKSTLQRRIQQDIQTFNSVKSFQAQQFNAHHVREFKDRFNGNFNETVTALISIFSFAVLKVADFGRIEAEGQIRIDAITKQVADTSQHFAEKAQEVDNVLRDAREAAGLTAVSAQATFFEQEAQTHASVAFWWKITTFIMAVLIVLAAAATLPLHKIPALEPRSSLDGYQLIASKVLLFAVLSYMLVLCSRNFMSHKHNYVVNKHCQNALLTFKALADAATDDKMKDIILTHASSCIFSPQDTGYTKGTGMSSSVDSKAIIGLIPGLTKGGE